MVGLRAGEAAAALALQHGVLLLGAHVVEILARDGPRLDVVPRQEDAHLKTDTRYPETNYTGECDTNDVGIGYGRSVILGYNLPYSTHRIACNESPTQRYGSQYNQTSSGTGTGTLYI